MGFYSNLINGRRVRKNSRRAGRVSAHRHIRGLHFEPLEDRRLLSTVDWTGGPMGTGTNLEDAANWGGSLPGPTDDAVIPAGFKSETITSATDLSVQSLTSAASLQLTGGTLTVMGGGLTLSNNATVYLGDASGTTYGQLYFEGDQSLGGTGTVVFGYSGSNELYSSGTLTIGSGITIRGNSGYMNGTAIVNQGTISADGSGGLVGGFGYDQGYSSSYTTYTATAIDTSGVTSPAPQAVYQTERYYPDPFSYTLGGLTAGGSYTLRLDFADLISTAAGQNTFNVTVNGTQVLTSFDIYAQAGNAEFKAVAQSFGATADSSGNITVELTPVTGYAQISGLEVQSGGSDVLAVNAGLLPGGTITVEPSTFTNQGSLQVSNGEALSVSGLSGNVGSATLSGSGSSLTLGGSNYVVNDGLTVAAGQTVALDGTWSNALGSTISANGATLDLGDQYNSSTNAWSNAGTITATNSTVNLGGLFTLADLGTFNRTGDVVNLVGTLDNTGTTLALDAATGSWNLHGGTVQGGTLSESGGAELVFTNYGGTLNGVTAASNLDLASINGAYAYVQNGLTLSNNATVYLGDASGTTYSQLYFEGDQSLGGTGTVVFGNSGSNSLYAYATLTIGSGVTIHGNSGYLNGTAIVNQGTISADDSGGLVGGFGYDQGYNGGYTTYTATAIDTSGVTSPAPQAVYQTERYYPDPFSYTLGGLTAGGSYTLRLDFADLLSSAAGQNVFNVTVNGTQVLTNFDIYAQASNAEFKAVAESFSATADNSGKITVEFAPVTGYAQINGLEVQSGGSDVLAVNAGLLPGGTITVEPSTFTNQGSLQASNGEALSVSGLSGNVGSATLSGSGSSLTLGGSNYVVNQGLTAAAGQTVTLDGTWTNAIGSTISATDATLNLGDQNSSSTNAWSNAGTISATNSTVNLGGLFALADLGTFNRTGEVVNLVGTLDNTGTTLALNATTGTWNLHSGTIQGGTLTEAGGAELVFTNYGGTLDGVTAASDLDLSTNYAAYAYVQNGLTLSNGATVYLGDASGTTYGQLYFEGDQSLGGTGTVVFGNSGNNDLYDPSGTLTIGSGITIRGNNGYLYGSTIVNEGTISADDSGGLVGGFGYDQGYNGGYTTYTATAIDTSGVTSPAPQAVYQTERYYPDPFSYTWAA